MLRHSIHRRSSILAGLLVFATSISTSLAARTRWSVEDVLGSERLPFAIGHRGSGANLGEDPDRPLENTLQSVWQAYHAGVRIVEVDVQITSDGTVVAFHDDFLDGFECINSLTFAQLKKRVPHIPRLREVLHVARSFSQRPRGPSGILIVEMKAPAPLCDPSDGTEATYATAVVEEILAAGMEDQVLLESFSPTLLGIAKELAPQIDRQLALSALQFLSPEEIEAITGLPVTVLDKSDFGLQWGEIGFLFRLPGFESFEQFVGVALALECRAVSLETLFLGQVEMTQPGAGAFLVDTLHSLGLSVAVFTLQSEDEWLFFESLGVDGLFVDDIDVGLALEPTETE